MNKTTTVIKFQPVQSEPETMTDVPKVIVFPPLLFVGAVISGATLQFLWPIHPPAALPARIIGAGLALAGIALVVSAKKSLSRAGTNVRPDKPTTAIVSDGPYRFTRNPIYLGASAAYLGVTLLLNAFWPIPALVPFFALLHWGVVRREELYLEQKFNDAYLAYKNRVRRWL